MTPSPSIEAPAASNPSGVQVRRLWTAALLVVAFLMVLTVVVPASVWRQPDVDATVQGFDATLMATDDGGRPASAAAVAVDPEQVRLIATPSSAPRINLMTGPLGYSASFDLQVLAAQPGSVPARVWVWAPYAEQRWGVVLESEPGRRVLLEQWRDGSMVSSRPVGVYEVAQAYRLEVDLDRRAGTASLRMRSRDGDVRPRPALDLQPGRSPFESHVISDPVAVTGGTVYVLGAVVNQLAPGATGTSVEWLDSRGARISVDGRWARADQQGWQGRRAVLVAPDGARSARVAVAAGEGARALFADVSLTDQAAPGRELLPNGGFVQGAAGWRRADPGPDLVFRRFDPVNVDVATDKGSFPGLFGSLRMALSVDASADGGFSETQLRDYRADVRHSRWLAVKVDDRRLDVLVVALAVLGVAALFVPARRRLLRALRRRWSALAGLRVVRLPVGWPVHVAAVAVYLLGSALLARAGSLNADVVGARVWAYVAADHGPGGLYFWPNVASAEAEQWRGLPLQEAGFPYGITSAYAFWGEGLVWKHLLSPMTGGSTVLVLDSLLRSMNALCGLLDAWLVAGIVAAHGGSRRTAARVGYLFLFNPALWLANSVWGTTQSLSLVVLLGSILLFRRGRGSWAFLLLLAALATRPQNLFPCAFIAVYGVSMIGMRRSVPLAARAVVAAFVLALPMSLAVSPTLTVDTWVNAFVMHVGDTNDTWTMPVSWGGFSVWPLVTLVVAGARGVDRILYPATEVLLGGSTYYQVGSGLALAVVAALGLVAVVRRRRDVAGTRYLVVLAAATTAFFTLNTATPSYHYLLPLTLVFAARPAMGARAWGWTAGALSVTTTLGMFCMGAYWLTAHPDWSIGVYDERNPLARWGSSAVLQDWFVTAACVANVAVLVALLVLAVAPRRRAGAAPGPVGGDRVIDLREPTPVGAAGAASAPPGDPGGARGGSVEGGA